MPQAVVLQQCPLAPKEILKDGVQPFDGIISDVTGKISLGYELYGVPETLLIGPQGVVLVRHAGPLTPDAFSEKFLPILNGELLPGARPAQSTASGPPMTSGERDALRASIQQCWNVGSLGQVISRLVGTCSSCRRSACSSSTMLGVECFINYDIQNESNVVYL